MALENKCLPQRQVAMHGVTGIQVEAYNDHFAIAASLAAIAREIDWNHDIPNKTEYVATLHAMARKISGDKAGELYPDDDE